MANALAHDHEKANVVDDGVDTLPEIVGASETVISGTGSRFW